MPKSYEEWKEGDDRRQEDLIWKGQQPVPWKSPDDRYREYLGREEEKARAQEHPFGLDK